MDKNIKRLIILGCAGSGKSTLATILGSKLGLPVYHLDRYFWQPGWVSVSREQFIDIQKDLIERDKWIIDGNYQSTVELRLNACDTVIFLDFPRKTCLRNVLKRRLMYHKKPRPDITEGCEEKIDLEFLRWIWRFNETVRPIILELLSMMSEKKQVIILKSFKEVELFVEGLILTG